jgi:hypothetical protein
MQKRARHGGRNNENKEASQLRSSGHDVTPTSLDTSLVRAGRRALERESREVAGSRGSRKGSRPRALSGESKS